jgi:soluble lytic murein transglycosylase-like protein
VFPTVPTHPKTTLAAACAAATIGLAGPSVLAAEPDTGESRPGSERRVALIEQPAKSFERSVDVHDARAEYEGALAEAREADVAPDENLLEDETAAPAELERAAEKLNERVKEADDAVSSPESFGVDQATLDAIASCESGGDPTAVSSDGTYRGKYQFDTGTWASVGGSGDPAAAPEEEQDMRAAMLYSRASSSPWPVCG